jgi:hypothetical protein
MSSSPQPEMRRMRPWRRRPIQQGQGRGRELRAEGATTRGGRPAGAKAGRHPDARFSGSDGHSSSRDSGLILRQTALPHSFAFLLVFLRVLFIAATNNEDEEN